MLKSLFLDPTDLNAYGRSLAQLLLIGGSQLETLAHGRHQVTFAVWSAAVEKSTSERGMSLQQGQLEWLWEALISEPKVVGEYGSLLRSRDQDWKNQGPVPVLKSGHVLGVFLKPFVSFDNKVLSLLNDSQPEAWITLHDTLTMAPGKATTRRFECRDVDAVVKIRVINPGSPEEEAILMKLEPDAVEVTKERVEASVHSLNHAFTVTSLRLQPHRRSHGGRAYDHVALRKEGHWVPLEVIRREVEAGKWKVE